MLKIIPLKEEHLEDAALLVSDRYRKLCEQEPHLPHRYSEVGSLLPLLPNISKETKIGMAAIHGNRLVGFLTGWQMPTFRGKRSIYSPEWANAADLEDSAHIYEALYRHLSAIWLEDKYIAHYISLFPKDVGALGAWNWPGFGMFAVDAIRGLESIQDQDENVRIRRAELADLDVEVELHRELRQ